MVTYTTSVMWWFRIDIGLLNTIQEGFMYYVPNSGSQFKSEKISYLKKLLSDFDLTE
jgi:hypothetical protein